MKYKLLSHTQGECYRELGDSESPDVCVDCAMLFKVVEQFYMDTERVEQIPMLRTWILKRETNSRLWSLIPAVLHFVRKMGFKSIKVRYNKIWHVYLYMNNMRFGGHAETFEGAYDEALGGYLNLVCGFEQKKRAEQRPSVSM